jgi:hypothetical protein
MCLTVTMQPLVAPIRQGFVCIPLSPENNVCFTVTMQLLVAPMSPTTNMM